MMQKNTAMVFASLLHAIENHYNLGERRQNVTGSLATCLEQASWWPQRKILLMVNVEN